MTTNVSSALQSSQWYNQIANPNRFQKFQLQCVSLFFKFIYLWFLCICCEILTQSGDQFLSPEQNFKNKNTICFLLLLIVDTRPTEHLKIGVTKLSIQWAKNTRFWMRVIHFSTFLGYPLQNNINKWSNLRGTHEKITLNSILMVNLSWGTDMQ